MPNRACPYHNGLTTCYQCDPTIGGSRKVQQRAHHARRNESEVTVAVYDSDNAKAEKLSAIQDALRLFPGATSHYLMQFGYVPSNAPMTSLGKDMQHLSLMVATLIERLEEEKKKA